MEKNMTKQKKDIKIFVSHRIDLDSEIIDNPLYVPVRCGAVYDERKNVTMLGDDTGENISEKRETYCELTVQYWAWKNIKVDYYGICHYRRFLSLAQHDLKLNNRSQAVEPILDNRAVNKYDLLNREKMRKYIEDNDAVVSIKFDVNNISTPKGFKSNVYDHWGGWDKIIIEKESIDLLLEVIEEFEPEYLEAAREYLNSKWHYGYNCFVMKKELFNELCKFQFGILFKLEKLINTEKYSQVMQRTLGFLGEILYGIFIQNLCKIGKYKIAECPIIYFEDTQKEININPAYKDKSIPLVLLSSNFYAPYLGVYLKSILNNLGDNYYDIIILHKEITECNQRLLQKMCEGYTNVSIRFYNPKRMMSGMHFYVASSNYSEEANYRLLTPWILSNYDKAIVTDCDMVAKRDISELYKIDMSDEEYIGATEDVVYQGVLNNPHTDLLTYCTSTMKMKKPYNYVNTGVMLLNLKAIRRAYQLREVLEFASKNHFRIQEQDIINVLFEGRIKFIDLKWNFYTEVNPQIKEALSYAPAEKAKAYYEAGNDPYIIHYANVPKPWSEPDTIYAEEWWMVARQTSFYEIILSRISGPRNQMSQDFENLSFARKCADKWFPKGSKRRECLKFFMPRNSVQWNYLKKVYHGIFYK